MNNCYLEKCLCCNSKSLKSVLDLGFQPLANSYTSSSDQPLPVYPLAINVCTDCWHAQQSFCVDRTEIFSSYAYVSGTSKTLDRFFAWFAKCVARGFQQPARVLEIAANDGSLLKHLQDNGLSCVGIDPASNIVEKAQSEGLPILCGFWPQTSDKIKGLFDVIVCLNVVGHVDNPRAFVEACKNVLKPGGAILIQPSQARIFGNGEFDTCYHEHISFFNSRSISALAEPLDLALFGARLVSIHGDSPLFILGHRDSPPPETLLKEFSIGEFAINEQLSQYEERVKLFEWLIYEAFQEKAQSILQNVKDLVAAYREMGYEIVCVGAAAKAMTVINASGIKPDRFLDESPLKIGLHAPGVGTRIESLEKCSSINRPALFLITAWNFRYELVDKMKSIGVPANSVFYSYFPEPGFIE